MSSLHQLRLQFVPEHDRLLLRMTTRDNHEFRMWLTRRFVKILWPILLNIASSDEEVSKHADPETRNAVLGFKHEKAVSQARFTKSFEDQPRELPLGETPILVTQIGVKRKENGTHTLHFRPTRGKGVDISFDDTLVHSFTKLLIETVDKIDWDVQFKFPAANPALTPESRRKLN